LPGQGCKSAQNLTIPEIFDENFHEVDHLIMASESAAIPQFAKEGFVTGQVLTIVSGHFIYDMHTIYTL
jgi:hypothetical protein